MRLGCVLLQQHSGKFFKNHWRVQGKRVLRDTGALKSLAANGIEYIDAEKFALPEKKPKKETNKQTFLIHHEDTNPPPIPEGKECLLLADGNVLLEGLSQAKVLTNTVELEHDTLPEDIFSKPLLIPEKCDHLVQSCIKRCTIYEAEQKKLPIRKDPTRPAWVFARDYGVTDRRLNELMCLRLMELCSQLTTSQRILENAKFVTTLDNQGYGGLQVVLSQRADLLVLSETPLANPADPNTSAPSLPSIAPLLPTVSIPQAERPEDTHPLTSACTTKHVKLAVFHYNKTEVKTEYELPVTDDQFLGRTLTKALTVALCQSRFLHGTSGEDIQEPVTLRAVHTDGQRFHFAVFQLNTLKTEGPVRNFFWHKSPQLLFERCTYEEGRPVLEGYNPKVFRTLLAFYNS